jgi:hypothetical protein
MPCEALEFWFSCIVKDRRRWSEGDAEWELIKISRRNLAYIPNLTRRPSLITRSIPHNYSKTIGLRNWVRDRNRNMKLCSQDQLWDRWQKLDRRTVYILTYISPKITAKEQFRLGNFESFDPTTQKLCRLPPANNSHRTETTIGQEQNPPAHTG